jgi:hypothetical protein
MKCGEAARSFIGAAELSYSQKNLSTIHPEQHKPEHQQHEDAPKQELVRLAEDFKKVLSQMSCEAAHDKVLEQVGDAIGRD